MDKSSIDIETYKLIKIHNKSMNYWNDIDNHKDMDNLFVANMILDSVKIDGLETEFESLVISDEDEDLDVDLSEENKFINNTKNSVNTRSSGFRPMSTYKKTRNSIYNMIHKFDFTICMGAYSLKDKKFILDDRFLLNNSSKELIFNNNTDFPIASLIRTIKYQKKGYTINGIQMMMIAMAIQNLKIKTYEDFRKHIQGIDQTELLELTERFRNNEISYDYKTMVEILQKYLTEHVYRGDAITE